jgi:hypothetical protein
VNKATSIVGSEKTVNHSAEEQADTDVLQVSVPPVQKEREDNQSQSKITPTVDEAPSATYRFSRFCFKAKEIEPLEDSQLFRMVTPDGTFQMTKAEFYSAFSNVVASKSYSESGIYHSKSVPKKALPYKLSE